MAPGGSPPRSPRSPGIAAMRSLGHVSSPGMDRNAAFLQFKAGAGQQLNQVGCAHTAHKGCLTLIELQSGPMQRCTYQTGLICL